MIHATENDVGRPVVYHPHHGKPEHGVISSIGLELVFVRYGNDAGGRPTAPGFLEWNDTHIHKRALEAVFGQVPDETWELVAKGEVLPPLPLPSVCAAIGLFSLPYGEPS